MKSMEITITTLSPVILTANRSTLMTGSENSISGTILRGLYAKKYREEHNLGTKAHEDESFRRFFFGGLRFVTARPMKHGQRSIMVPRSIQASKDGNDYNDMMVEPNPADYEKGFKNKKGQAVLRSDGAIDYVGVSKNTSLHIDRHSNANRISGSSQDGGVFTYEAVEPGEIFVGYVIGEDDTVEEFAKEISSYSSHCRIGRSSSTQYGHCRIDVGVPHGIEAIVPAVNTICVRLETPLIAHEPFIEAKKTLEKLFSNVGTGISITDIFGGQEELYGHNSIWQTKIPCQYMLAAGTIFRLTRQEGWESIDLTSIFYDGLGLHREEGFGQLRLWTADNSIKPWPKEEGEDSRKIRYVVKNREVQRVARIIIEKKLEKQVKIDAYMDVQRIRVQLKGKTHAFAVLETLLGIRERLAGIQARFKTALTEFKSEQLHTHLRNVKLGSGTLEEKILAPISYTDSLSQSLQDFALKVGIAEAKEGKTVFSKEISGAAYYDYWMWFFRHARKAAQSE